MKFEGVKELIKSGTGIVVAIGVGAIVGNIVKSTTPSDMRKVMKACVAIGGFVLTNAAGDIASKYADEKIDETADLFVKYRDSKKEEEDTHE